MTQSVEQAAQVPGRVIEDVTIQPASTGPRSSPKATASASSTSRASRLSTSSPTTPTTPPSATTPPTP